MCGRLATKYKECSCTRAETTRRCDKVREYLGAGCRRWQNIVILVPGRCRSHLEEYHGTGGDDYDYQGYGSDGMEIDGLW